MYSSLLGECLSSTHVIYSCGLGSCPHAIKMLFGCTLVTHLQFILPFFPPLPSFLFSSVLLTGRELFHHATDDILLFVKVAEERLLDDCCHLSDLFFSTSVFSVMCWLCRHHTSYCKRWHLLSCHAVHIPTEYMWWFAKTVLLSDAFHGLSVMFWWLGFSWSILVLAICSYVPKFIVESTSWTLHFDTLWMLLFSINLCVRVCRNHIRDETDPFFLASLLSSLSSTLSHEFPEVKNNEWGQSLSHQLKQSQAFLICSD